MFHQTVTFANATAYATYRLTFPTLKDAPNANSMQIAEVELLEALPPSPLPTLGGWGLMALAIFLLAGGAYVHRRRPAVA